MLVFLCFFFNEESANVAVGCFRTHPSGTTAATLCTHTRVMGQSSSRPRGSWAGLEQRAALIAAGVTVVRVLG